MNKKRFFLIFGISFAIAAVVTVFMMLVVFRGFFYNIYISKGDSAAAKSDYTKALTHYESARSWTPNNQGVYIKMAEAYAALEDYDMAGEVIDEAIKKKVTTKSTGLEQLHMMRVKIYTANGRLYDASNYIASINDQYIRKKIESARPDDLVYTPTHGSYDKSQKMSITVRDGETVYYTTDGSYPTKFSNVYVEPINIPLGDTDITAISVNKDGLVSPILVASYTVTNENEEVTFNDPKMEQMVRNALGKPYGTIKMKELEEVTELSNDGCDGHLKTLSDIELMPNLAAFHIENEKKLISISQLSGRTKLTSLTLASCDLSSEDINALGSLTSLQSLDLTDNSLTSVAVLSNLPDLRYLFIGRNNIEDISAVASLENLLVLDASENTVQVIPNLSTSVESLYLSKNRISDLSGIHTLRNLTILDLSSNIITDAKNIGQLENLETLTLSNNSITDFEFLSTLDALTALDVSNTGFSSTKSLAKLSLITLTANGTDISTVADIAKISTLTSLSIANTDVTDIKALSVIPTLDYLEISGCKIKDLSVLSRFKGLYTLWAIGLDVEDIEFANDDVTVITEN